MRLETMSHTTSVVAYVAAVLKEHVWETFMSVGICISNWADVVAASLRKALGVQLRRFICTGTYLNSARQNPLLTWELKGSVSPVFM